MKRTQEVEYECELIWYDLERFRPKYSNQNSSDRNRGHSIQHRSSCDALPDCTKSELYRGKLKKIIFK